MIIKFSRTALFDLADIENYSLARWGKNVTETYLDSVDKALEMLATNPNLLRDIPKTASTLKFYRVKQHYLICTVLDSVIYVVTIKHCSMDIPNRLTELEPTLQHEVKIMHKAFLEAHRKD